MALINSTRPLRTRGHGLRRRACKPVDHRPARDQPQKNGALSSDGLATFSVSVNPVVSVHDDRKSLVVAPTTACHQRAGFAVAFDSLLSRAVILLEQVLGALEVHRHVKSFYISTLDVWHLHSITRRSYTELAHCRAQDLKNSTAIVTGPTCPGIP